MKKIKRQLSRVLGGNGEKPQQQNYGDQQFGDQHCWPNSQAYNNMFVAVNGGGKQYNSNDVVGSAEFFPGAFNANPHCSIGPGRGGQYAPEAKTKSRCRWSLSDSLSQLGERIAEMTVEEECGGQQAAAGRANGRINGNGSWALNGNKNEAAKCAAASQAGTSSATTCGAEMEKPVVLMRSKKQQQRQFNPRTKSWHASRWFGHAFGHSAPPAPAPPKLGSDGESEERSPSSSEQHSSCSNSQQNSGGGGDELMYIPNVKMRQKHQQKHQANSSKYNNNAGGAANGRRWNEEEVQKRLSLPAYINIPQAVVEKLNRAAPPATSAALESQLSMSRKSRRASLSEIGFGKLETYRKVFDVGEGTYATVYLGQSLLTGQSVALKEIRLEHEEGAPCTAIREVSLLRNLKHANIVLLHDVVHTDSVLTLVFEYVEQDLREYMEALDTAISVANVRLFLFQLLRGLAYCHARRILHRDLKPQNLLITQGGELKLADFGLARAQSFPTKTYSSEVVTLWYRPPDLLLGSTEYTTQIDMWAVGCILFEMLTHRPMFPASSVPDQLQLIFKHLGTPTAESNPEMCALPGFKKLCRNFRHYRPRQLINVGQRLTEDRVDLLLKLLKYDGKQRISAAQAMRHPFLQCFPEAIFKLTDTESIFALPNLQYVPDARRDSFPIDEKGGEEMLFPDVSVPTQITKHY